MEAKILSNLWQVGGPGFTSPDDAVVYCLMAVLETELSAPELFISLKAG